MIYKADSISVKATGEVSLTTKYKKKKWMNYTLKHLIFNDFLFHGKVSYKTELQIIHISIMGDYTYNKGAYVSSVVEILC